MITASAVKFFVINSVYSLFTTAMCKMYIAVVQFMFLPGGTHVVRAESCIATFNERSACDAGAAIVIVNNNRQ